MLTGIIDVELPTHVITKCSWEPSDFSFGSSDGPSENISKFSLSAEVEGNSISIKYCVFLL